MLNFSWNEWLQGKSARAARRKPRNPGETDTPRVEGLEIRTLLTAPVAVADSGYVVNEDTTLNATISVLDNDTDDDSDPLTAELVSNAANGTVTLNSDGTFTYVPNLNFHGIDTFTYNARDINSELSATPATVTITVNPVTDLSAVDGVFATDEDQLLTGNVSTNDSTTSTGLLTYSLVQDVAHGQLALSPDGSFTYDPDSNYNGPDSFMYLVTDAASGESLTRTAVITVNPVTDLTAVSEPFVISEDTQLIDDVSLNDSTTSGGSLTYTVQSGVAHGSLTLTPSGGFVYTPDPNYVGDDSFDYLITDTLSGETAIRTATITILPVVDLIASDDTFSGAEDGQITGDVSTNDSTTSGGTLVYSVHTDVQHGLLTLNLDGTFTYTPSPNYHGSDSFEYEVSDPASGESLIRTASLTITPVVDLTAGNDSFTIDEDTPLSETVAVNDSTTSGGTLTYSVSSNVSHGVLILNPDGTFSYTPTANYYGSDSFDYLVTDASSGESLVRTVSITVNSVVDLTADDDTFTTAEDTLLSDTVAANDSTTSGGSLSYSVATNVSHGVLVLNSDGTFTYTPAANYHGSDSFTYLVTDSPTGENATRTVQITVTPVVDLTAENDSFTTNEDTVLNDDVSPNDTTTSSGLLVYSIDQDVTHGTLNFNSDGTFSYTPDANYNGPDSFSYLVTDATSGESLTRTVAITVTAVADLTATNDDFTTDEEVVLNENVATNDSTTSGGSLTYALETNVSHGTLSFNPNGTFTYTPALNFFGTDTFTYTATDATAGESATRTVTIHVNGLNDAPTVSNGAGIVNEDAFLVGSLSPLGNDVDGDQLAYSVVTPPAHGTLTLSPDGTFVYVPNANYSGPDSFTFRANDGTVNSNTGTFSLTVENVDDQLVLTLPSAPVSVPRTSTQVSIDGGASVADPDTTINYNGSQVSVSILSGGTSADYKNGRITVSIKNQGTGVGLVKVKGTKIYFDGSSTAIGAFSGGANGKPLVITFNSAATQQAVNAVLKQITIQASKRASTGTYWFGFVVSTQNQIASAAKSVNVV